MTGLVNTALLWLFGYPAFSIGVEAFNGFIIVVFIELDFIRLSASYEIFPPAAALLSSSSLSFLPFLLPNDY